jgi:hypothetical protein
MYNILSDIKPQVMTKTFFLALLRMLDCWMCKVYESLEQNNNNVQINISTINYDDLEQSLLDEVISIFCKLVNKMGYNVQIYKSLDVQNNKNIYTLLNVNFVHSKL